MNTHIDEDNFEDYVSVELSQWETGWPKRKILFASVFYDLIGHIVWSACLLIFTKWWAYKEFLSGNSSQICNFQRLFLAQIV